MRPRILVTTDTNNGKFRNYVSAIEKAGGDVLAVNERDDAQDAIVTAKVADGWLITGGRDLPPTDEPLHPMSELISDNRLAIENAVFEVISESGKPILGICMGAQFLNTRAGGPLEQHIADLGIGGHGAVGGIDERTAVRVSPDSLLARSLAATAVTVYCHHHQSIRAVGQGYEAVAWEDGEQSIIEAIEDACGRWRIGVQWHPERTPDVASDNLFRAFINAC